MKKIIIILIIILSFTGCYNYKELNKIAIVSSIAIDKKDDKYLVSAQVMNAKQDKESESSQVVVYEAKGETINGALRNMTMKAPRTIYGGHLSKLVISEEIAKEGIANIIDGFQRLTEIRNEFTITIARNIEASKVIKIMTSTESVPAEYVKTSLETADISSALTYSTKLDEFASLYLKKGIDPVIAVIEVDNYEKKGTTLDNTDTTDPITKIVLGNIAVTNNGKFEKYLTKDETIGYNFIRNQVEEIVIPVKCDDKYYASITVLKNKTKYKVDKVNNKYQIKYFINSNGVIGEYDCSDELIKEKVINNLEKKAEKKIKYYINKALEAQKNSKSKFLGFERNIYLNYPKYKDEEYEIKLNVNLELSRKGELRNSSKGAKKNEY